MAKTAYEITWSGTLAGQFVQTVQHMFADEAGTENPFQQAQNLISPVNFDGINDLFMDCLPADYVMTSIRCRRVFPTTGPTAVHLASTYATSIGQRSGQISAAQVNPVILWIPLDEPTHLGKLFIPGVVEDDIDQMLLVTALITAIENFIGGWIAGQLVGALTYVGGVARRDPSPPHAVTDIDLIEFGQISPLIGTQRRRLRPV